MSDVSDDKPDEVCSLCGGGMGDNWYKVEESFSRLDENGCGITGGETFMLCEYCNRSTLLSDDIRKAMSALRVTISRIQCKGK